jgi:hypothetical protein
MPRHDILPSFVGLKTVPMSSLSSSPITVNTPSSENTVKGTRESNHGAGGRLQLEKLGDAEAWLWHVVRVHPGIHDVQTMFNFFIMAGVAPLIGRIDRHVDRRTISCLSTEYPDDPVP